jgi:Zn ribbon nucleic-acid-binding protein
MYSVEQERLITVLKDTVALLCKNSLTFEDQVQVQGLICITVDKQDVLVVPVHESVGQAEFEPCVACGHAKEPPAGHARKRKRHRRSSSTAVKPLIEASDQELDDRFMRNNSENGEVAAKIKKEEVHSDEDLVLLSEDVSHEESQRSGTFVDSSEHGCITAASTTPQQQLLPSRFPSSPLADPSSDGWKVSWLVFSHNMSFSISSSGVSSKYIDLLPVNVG